MVKDRIAVSRSVLRPFDVCSIVKHCMAVSILPRPLDLYRKVESNVCSMVADRIAVRSLLRPTQCLQYREKLYGCKHPPAPKQCVQYSKNAYF